MSDWQRNRELDGELGNNQLGQTASLIGFDAKGVGIIEASNVIRWQGDRYDLNAWRIYLGPWKPKPEMPISTNDESIAADFPTAGIAPRMRPEQTVSFAAGVLVWAQIQWGSGGVQHSAWVDWPIAGLLLQVSGSYVQVNALAASYELEINIGDRAEGKLPDLPATLSDEPGGGDSARSATFTYPMQGQDIDWTSQTRINFPVVPFARACFFEWDNTQDGGSPDYATSVSIAFWGPNGDQLDGDYVYTFNAGDIGDPRDGIPLPPTTAYVTVTPAFTGSPVTPLFEVGLSFELDL